MLFFRFLSAALVYSCLLGRQELVGQDSQLLPAQWQVREWGDSSWLPAQVPGCVHTDLLAHQRIPDPFWGENEASLQWVGEKEWEYEGRFEVPEGLWKRKHIALIFEGLDTYASVFLNDSLFLTADNMFRIWEREVKGRLKKGENVLRIRFHSAESAKDSAWKALGYELPGGKRVMSRKAAFHFGWDWAPRFVTAGIWRPVRLLAWDEVRLRDVFFHPTHLSPDAARLSCQLEVESKRARSVLVEVKGKVEPFVQTVALDSGLNKLDFQLNITGKPRLWWSRGLGEPFRYALEVQLRDSTRLLASKQQKVGLRRIRLLRQPDSLRPPDPRQRKLMDSLGFEQQSFYFELNGVPLFAKGANYIPQDPFQPRVGKAAYEQLIDNACKANMNMLRVWGGGIYEEDIFYELCDEKGMLVWQDFMFACAMYPGDSVFLQNVEAEAIQNLKRLRQHPSIALWCGNNENKEGWHRWGWQPAFSETQRQDRWQDYEALFHKLLPELVRTYQPDLDYWPSSPSYGRGNPRHLFEGDSHYWGVWHDAEAFEILGQRIPRFMSEFGFQAFPGPKAVAEFSRPEDRELLSPVMLAHQKHPRGNELIMTYLKRELPRPKDFDDFLYLSQLLQAEGMRLGLEAQRRARPFCMGTLYWQLNDCWPVASWSGLDYRGRWKALHYAVREAFAEVMVSVEKREGQLQAWLVSDRLDTLRDCELQVELWSHRGRLLQLKRLPLDLLPAQSRVYWQAPAEDWGLKKARKRFLRLALRDGEDKEVAEKFFYYLPPKNLKLARPHIKWDVKKQDQGYWIHLQTDRPARAVRLSHPAEGWFSHNWFDLFPGEGKSLFFHTNKEIANFTSGLKVRSLWRRGE